jgi:pimeloyl-ACP methyl ester carboxylesterase
MPMPYTTTQGVRIHHQVEGEGPPLVIQHGFTDRMETWYELRPVETLKHDDRLMLVDTRENGHSDNPHDPDAPGREFVAGEVVAVLDAVNRPQLDLRAGKWQELEPEDTAFAVRARPRCSGWRLVAMAALATAGLAAFLSPATAAGSAPASSAAPVPELAWQPCADPRQSGFDCATAQVPLDYGDLQGSTIDLAVIRHRATAPANRIGTLFFNPGGPGGVGTEDLPAWFELFPAELRARFDLISWDPRGIGASTAVQCFATPDEGLAFFSDLPAGFPVGGAEERAWIRGYARFGQLCTQRNGDLLEHVSTVDTARDLDLLRQAVGDPQLTYRGTSYGTFLGATYANLFPDRVRAMVLDGNVDPVSWTNGGDDDALLSTSLRAGSDKASAQTLNAFLRLCGQASTDQCAFSAGSAAATQAKFATLLQRLRKQPIPFEGEPVTYAALVSAMGGVLFTSQAQPGFPGWAAFAQVLQTLWTGGSGGTPPPPSYQFPEQALAVACAESPNPRRPVVFRVLGALSYARAGDIGPSWSWGDEPCASWPATAADRYSGPWNRPTANPVLVIGNTFDPSTPYEGAVAMANNLARARLLTVDGYGHTVLLNPSACASTYESRYFVDGTLPPPGTVCQQDQQPFTTSPVP